MMTAASLLAPGQINTLDNGTIQVGTAAGVVEVQPMTADIFRITTLPEGVTESSAPTQAVTLQPESQVKAMTFTTPQWVKVITPTTIATVNRLTGRVTFTAADGTPLLSETTGVDNRGDLKRIAFSGADSGRLYGAGERGHKLSLNGDSLVMYNRQNYSYGEGDPRLSQMGITVPWFVSDRGYGVLFDDYNMATLSLGGDSIVYSSETPRALSYYFVNSPAGDLAGATQGYADLTGHQPLPPFWSLGYITSKYGYHNQQEALGAIDSLKQRGYPVDGIILDLYWYGVETDMGRLEWDSVQWPDHKGMLAELRDKGVNLVAISQPYVNKKGAIDNYNYLSERSMLATDADGNTHDVTTWVGDAGMLDVSNPKTREWLAERYKSLTRDGIEGWWGDLGDLEVHPLTIRHHNGETASQYHNVYGNEWSKIIYDMLREYYPERRPVLLMRGGTAGLQRYSVFPWTTDVARSWEGMQPQVKLMLNSGLSGLGYMSSDIGGFAVDPQHPVDPELYVRWLQMGAFTPVLRTHAQLKPEPYHYPQMENITSRYIRMRYEWLPYNYTLAYENARYGYPMARPLNFRGDNPDKKYSEIEDEYLWGDNVLVAPVMKAGQKARQVTFPAGEWVDWYNAARVYKGGKTAVVPAPLSQMPLFVRRGAFVPQYTQPIENVTQYNPVLLNVRYYPSAEKTSYTMYMDDRFNPSALDENDYQLTTFTGEETGDTIVVNVSSEGTYLDMPEVRMLTLDIPGYGTKSPRRVEADGIVLDRAMSVKAIRQYGYALTGTTLSVVLPINAARPSRIEIVR